MAYNTKHIHLFDKKKLEVKNIRRSSFGYKKGTTRVV